MEVLLKRFCLNGHTIGFEAQFIVPCEGTTEEVPFEWSHHRILKLKRFHLNGHAIGFEAQT